MGQDRAGPFFARYIRKRDDIANLVNSGDYALYRVSILLIFLAGPILEGRAA